MRLIRLIDRERIKLQLEWEPADLWVGVFWRITRELPSPWYILHVFGSLIPTLPLHLMLCLRDHRAPG